MRGLLVALAALVLLVGLACRDLWEPDEPRLAAVAEELRSMRHGPAGLVLLHLSGEPYTQKPPLYYWLAALAGVPGGRVSEGPARLPSALAGVAVVALTLSFGSGLLGPRTALLGAGLLLSIQGFADLARRAQLDVLLTLFEWIALLAFWRWDRGIGNRAASLALLHGALGFAVLTKGPVGVLVPFLAFAGYLASEGRLRRFPGLLPPWALLLSLGPALAWLASAVALAPPGFFGEAVGTNVLGRFFAGTSHARPFYYYLYALPIECLPWTLLWPLVGWAGRRRVFVPEASPERRRAWRLLLAWVGAALLFFSLSAGKRGLYLAPTLPALSLLCADALVERLEGRRSLPRWIAAVAAGIGLAGLATATLILVRPTLAGPPLPRAAAAALAAAVLATAGLSLCLRATGAPALARFAVLVAGIVALEVAVHAALLPALDPVKSPRPIAQAAAAITAPAERIGLVGNRAKLGGLAYYSGRDVVHLEDGEAIRGFLAAGGRTLVVQARKLDRIRAVADVEIRARLREGEGDRAWLVVAPADPG